MTKGIDYIMRFHSAMTRNKGICLADLPGVIAREGLPPEITTVHVKQGAPWDESHVATYAMHEQSGEATFVLGDGFDGTDVIRSWGATTHFMPHNGVIELHVAAKPGAIA